MLQLPTTESVDQESVIVWVRHIHSYRNERCNRHVRIDVESENVDLSWTPRHQFAMRSRAIICHVCRKFEIQTPVIQSSPRRSHQSNGAVENYQKQLQRQVRTMLAARGNPAPQAGRQVGVRRVAGQERPHRRTPGQNR